MSRNTPTFRPGLEALEARLPLTASIAHGTLTVGGGAQNDKVVVYQMNDPKVGPILKVFETIGNQPRRPPQVFRVADISKGAISFSGQGGNDSFNYLNLTTSPGLRVVAYGGPGDDVLVGADGNDDLSGGEGQDVLDGWRGDDILVGGAGGDAIWGADGSDRLYGGGSPSEKLTGPDGVDTLYGQAGNDYLDGGADGLSDRLCGGEGADLFVIEPALKKVNDKGQWVTREINLDQPTDLHPWEGDVIGAGL